MNIQLKNIKGKLIMTLKTCRWYCIGGGFFFHKFKQGIIDAYSDLFAGNGNDGNTNDGFSDRWGWYQSLYSLSQGRIDKFDIIAKLTFEKQKNELEKANIKKRH